METTLRPLTLGELLDRTAQLYRTNFPLFAGIAAAYAAIALIINLVSVLVLEAYKTSRFASVVSWQMQLLSWSSLVVMMIVSNVAGAANNRAVAWVHLGEPATIRTAYRSILPHFWRYLGLGTLKLLVAGSPVMVMYGAFQASYIHFVNKGVLPRPGEIPAPTATPNPDSLIFGLITLGFGIVIWPVLIYAVFMALRYALALPASVVENLKLRAAIRRGIALSKGSRGRIFVLWMLVLVIEFMALALTQTFFVLYSVRHHYQLPVGLRIAQQIVSFFTNTFVGPILAIGTTLFYYDQRVRKEGYDIEWMMAAAGLAGVSAQPSEGAVAAEGGDASMPGNGQAPGLELHSSLQDQGTGTDA
jgi:hypothetical protein